MTLARLIAIGLLLAGYALLSNMLMVHVPDQPWVVAALFGPLLTVLAWTGWRRRHGATLALCAAILAALALVVARGGVRDIALVYVLQHVAIHVVLAWTFGVTLRAGATPLITALGERVHRNFTPAMRAYTRTLTAAWTAYFLAMVMLSLAIYALASWEGWALFCNVITPLFVLAFFVGEHRWRRLRHPEFERITFALMVEAYRGHRSSHSAP